MADPKWVDMPLALDWEIADRWPEQSSVEWTGSIQGATTLNMLSVRTKSRLVNWLPIKDGEQVRLRPRDFINHSSTLFAKGAGSLTNPRGIFWGHGTQRLCELWNTDLYVWSADDTYTTVSTMGSASEGPGGFAEGIDSSGVPYIFACTKSKSVVVKTTGNTTVSDSDYPSSIIPTPVFLDSYIFVAQQGTRNIFNSAVGDPTSWAASTFITTEEHAGNVVALARTKRYLVALCEKHIEFFRDAGIAFPNSPLSRVSELSVKIGCINRATVAVHGDVIYFAGTANGKFNFYKIEDDRVIEIGTPSTSWLLGIHGGSADTNGIPAFGAVTNWNQSDTIHNFGTGYMIPFLGKVYYIFVPGAGRTIKTSTTSHRAHPAIIYDPELKIWIEVAMGYKNTDQSSAYVRGGWGYPFGTFVRVTSNSASSLFETFLMQNAYGGADDDGQLSYLSTVNSGGEIVDCKNGGVIAESPITILQIQWPVMDFGTAAKKTISGLQIIDSGRGTNLSTGGSQSSPMFAWYGQYLPGESSASYSSITLSDSSHTLPNGELSQIIRRMLASNFFAQTFMLQQNMRQWHRLDAVRVRVQTFDPN